MPVPDHFVKRAEQVINGNLCLNATREWLVCCLEWLIDEKQLSFQSTTNEIGEKVCEQWLHTDLTIMEQNCLPPSVDDQALVQLNGKFPLQLETILDISKSAYGQLSKFTGVSNENEAVTAEVDYQIANKQQQKVNRMIKMELTDGTRKITAMEYQPIKQLHTNLPPGTKVMLEGCMECRLGCVLLKAENVRVMGGYVEAKAAEGSQINVLTNALQNSGRLVDDPTNPQNENIKNALEHSYTNFIFRPAPGEIQPTVQIRTQNPAQIRLPIALQELDQNDFDGALSDDDLFDNLDDAVVPNNGLAVDNGNVVLISDDDNSLSG